MVKLRTDNQPFRYDEAGPRPRAFAADGWQVTASTSRRRNFGLSRQ